MAQMEDCISSHIISITTDKVNVGFGFGFGKKIGGKLYVEINLRENEKKKPTYTLGLSSYI